MVYSDFFRVFDRDQEEDWDDSESPEETIPEEMPQANLAESRSSSWSLNEVDWQIAQSLLELAKMVARLVRLASLARRSLSPDALARIAGLQAASQSVAASLRKVEGIGESAALRRDFSRALERIAGHLRGRLQGEVAEGVWSRFVNPRARFTPEQIVALGCRLLFDVLRNQEAALHASIAQAAADLELDKTEASTLGEAVGDIILVLKRQAKGAPEGR